MARRINRPAAGERQSSRLRPRQDRLEDQVELPLNAIHALFEIVDAMINFGNARINACTPPDCAGGTQG